MLRADILCVCVSLDVPSGLAPDPQFGTSRTGRQGGQDVVAIAPSTTQNSVPQRRTRLTWSRCGSVNPLSIYQSLLSWIRVSEPRSGRLSRRCGGCYLTETGDTTPAACPEALDYLDMARQRCHREIIINPNTACSVHVLVVLCLQLIHFKSGIRGRVHIYARGTCLRRTIYSGLCRDPGSTSIFSDPSERTIFAQL